MRAQLDRLDGFHILLAPADVPKHFEDYVQMDCAEHLLQAPPTVLWMFPRIWAFRTCALRLVLLRDTKFALLTFLHY